MTNGTYPSPDQYWMGRFSNGPVWNEQLKNVTNKINKIVNYAFGGATACKQPANISVRGWNQTQLPALTEEYAMLKPLLKDMSTNRALFIWMGHNDFFVVNAYIQALEEPGLSDAAKEAYITTFLTDLGRIPSCIREVVEGSLAAKDFKQVVVGTLCPIQLSPMLQKFSILLPSLAPVIDGVLEGIILTINRRIKSDVEELAQKYRGQAQVKLWDANRDMTTYIRNYQKYGFTNNSQACMSADGNNVTVCATPNTYVFWDEVHPTTAGHTVVRDSAYRVLKQLTLLKV